MPAATKAYRWNVETAAGEFGIDRKTLSKRIRTAGIEPGGDGKFSTKQIAAAIFGDIHGEVLRKTREEADKLALENEKRRGALLEADRAYKHFEGVFVVFRQKLLASSLSDDEKDELLNELRGLKTRIFTD